MKEYILGYKKAAVLGILAVILSIAAYFSWPHVEAAAQYDARMLWENIRKLIIGLCFMPAVTIAWLTYADRNLNSSESEIPSEVPTDGKSLKGYIPIIITCIVLYTLLALLMYCSWLQEDDVSFSWNYEKTAFKTRIVAAFGTYLATVSRSGDFLMQIFPLPSNRWPCYTITPLAVILIPFFIGRLFGKTVVWWTSRTGISFYIFTFFLILLSVDVVDCWRNYRWHAAVMNYLWPSCATLLFLSLFNPANWKYVMRNKYLKNLSLIGTFLLGFYCAWGTESGTVAIIIILSVFYAWHFLKHKKIPVSCTTGTAGAMWGALVLLSSPSFKIRSVFAGETFGKWHLQSNEDLLNIVHNLSWEKIIEYNGGGIHSTIILKSIPFFERIYFLPYLAERFWKCCQIPAVIAASLLVIVLCKHTDGNRKKILITSAAVLALSAITASSFLMGCIPTTMSFLPSSYIVAILACYLFIKLPENSLTSTAFSIWMALGALVFFIPIGIEAWAYKKYEYEYITQIQQQKAEGKQDLTITCSIPQDKGAPKNTLRLISSIDTLNGSSNSFAKIYQVDSIRFIPKVSNESEPAPKQKQQQ